MDAARARDRLRARRRRLHHPDCARSPGSISNAGTGGSLRASAGRAEPDVRGAKVAAGRGCAPRVQVDVGGTKILSGVVDRDGVIEHVRGGEPRDVGGGRARRHRLGRRGRARRPDRRRRARRSANLDEDASHPARDQPPLRRLRPRGPCTCEVRSPAGVENDANAAALAGGARRRARTSTLLRCSPDRRRRRALVSTTGSTAAGPRSGTSSCRKAARHARGAATAGDTWRRLPQGPPRTRSRASCTGGRERPGARPASWAGDLEARARLARIGEYLGAAIGSLS